jgi:hypothetical protein
MAKYLQGINGIFIGKVGTVVGCVWKGIPYMRSQGNPRTGPPTEAEAKNHSKFATAHHWLQPLLVFLRAGFAGYSETVNGYNAAKSYNLTKAMLEGQIVPELVKVSYGNLPQSKDLSVTCQNAQLHFNWSTAELPEACLKDQVMVLAYHPQSKVAIFDTQGAFRSMGNHILDTYREFIGKTVHVYAAFVAADRSKQSDSLYLGAIDC